MTVHKAKNRPRQNRPKRRFNQQLITEIIGGEEYSYYRLGEYLVAAPGVCGGRPTIRGRRLDARHILASIRAGEPGPRVAEDLGIPLAAVEEVIRLADVYDYEQSYA